MLCRDIHLLCLCYIFEQFLNHHTIVISHIPDISSPRRGRGGGRVTWESIQGGKNLIRCWLLVFYLTEWQRRVDRFWVFRLLDHRGLVGLLPHESFSLRQKDRRRASGESQRMRPGQFSLESLSRGYNCFEGFGERVVVCQFLECGWTMFVDP